MSALSPRQMFLLDEACKPIRDGFGDTPYLVGTANERQPYRDVDVRLILKDKKFRRLKEAIGMRGIAFLGLAIGEYLQARTDLPVDFQIQQQTSANHHHGRKMRNPLGLRELVNYAGDAPLVLGTAANGAAIGEGVIVHLPGSVEPPASTEARDAP